MPGAFGIVIACFSARPLRGRTCASYPGGTSIVSPVGTRRGMPGSSSDVLHRVQVHSGILGGAVSVVGQDGLRGGFVGFGSAFPVIIAS